MTGTKNSAGSNHILVVDDEEIVLDAITDFLDFKGFHVDSARSVDEALDKMEVDCIDLVLTDISMPVRNGSELLDEIRRHHPDTAVIMMTGYAETGAAVEAMKAGAFDYIAKPFNYDTLLLNIERAFEKTSLVKLNREHQNTLEEKVMQQSAMISEMYLETVSALTIAIEAKDEYTKGHSLRVTEYVQLLLERLDWTFEIKTNVLTAAQLHDIGKLGIDDAILNKPGKLDDDEFEVIKTHPLTSEKILKPILSEETIQFVRHHHERWDGKGYPDGLAGEDIPAGARAIALGDAFDAMTSKRAYRDAREMDWAFEEIYRCSGTQFDPALVDDFINAIRNFCGGSAK